MVLVDEPALPHTVLGEPLHPLFSFADSWIWRQDLDDEVWRAADPVADDPFSFVGDEEQIGLNDQRPLLVQDNVER